MVVRAVANSVVSKSSLTGNRSAMGYVKQQNDHHTKRLLIGLSQKAPAETKART
jgi:hypothetical protein